MGTRTDEDVLPERLESSMSLSSIFWMFWMSFWIARLIGLPRTFRSAKVSQMKRGEYRCKMRMVLVMRMPIGLAERRGGEH